MKKIIIILFLFSGTGFAQMHGFWISKVTTNPAFNAYHYQSKDSAVVFKPLRASAGDLGAVTLYTFNSADNITSYLPASPVEGQVVMVLTTASVSGILTIDGNGLQIYPSPVSPPASTFVFENKAGEFAMFIYTGSAWYITTKNF